MTNHTLIFDPMMPPNPEAGRLYLRRRPYAGGTLFVVIDDDGAEVSDALPLEQARAVHREMQAALDNARKKRARPCMCCATPFDSRGMHNRLCSNCRYRGDVTTAMGLPQTRSATGKRRFGKS